MDWLMGKTKRKEARIGEEEKPYLVDDVVRQRITDVDFSRVVQLPTDMDLNEWLATNTIKFFEHINYFFGAICEYCNSACEKCALMTGPNDTVHQWIDDKGRKVKVSATQYIEYVMTFTQKTICDESVFPTKYGNVFPASFEQTMRKVHRLLLHVLAHLFHAHFKQFVDFNLHAFLNTFALHFMLFARRFALVDNKDLETLDDLFQKLSSAAVRVIGKDDSKSSSLSSDNTSQTSLSPTSTLGERAKAASAAMPIDKNSSYNNSGGSSLPCVAGSPHVAAVSHLNSPQSRVMDALAAEVHSLSSSPSHVLTTQPNGHPRQPST